jgi:hypothetical protein
VFRIRIRIVSTFDWLLDQGPHYECGSGSNSKQRKISPQRNTINPEKVKKEYNKIKSKETHILSYYIQFDMRKKLSETTKI